MGAGFVEEEVPTFEIVQDPGSGALTVANLTFEVHGVAYRLFRPLNARTAWPLYLGAEENNVEDPDLEIRVFDESGILSAEMMEFLLRGT